MSQRRRLGHDCSDEVPALPLSSSRKTAAIFAGLITGFAFLPAILDSIHTVSKVARPAALHVDELPANFWPLPLLQYAQPQPAPDVLPPARTFTPADLARYGPTNNAPDECAALAGDGARSGDNIPGVNCAYITVPDRIPTRDERLIEIQKILGARDLQPEIRLGWQQQPDSAEMDNLRAVGCPPTSITAS
jgi:hypothetical protein